MVSAEMMSEPSRDTLSRWWSPLQWLRIACSAWVDQAWYWQNVRPHLRGRKQGWGLFGQAVLGATLASALAATAVRSGRCRVTRPA
ncbi:MAG: hypothetical protein QME94_03910 [Anaerolineae bacterium]|nr:hypothetical protein [Anaerolineae bacterium]